MMHENSHHCVFNISTDVGVLLCWSTECVQWPRKLNSGLRSGSSRFLCASQLLRHTRVERVRGPQSAEKPWDATKFRTLLFIGKISINRLYVWIRLLTPNKTQDTQVLTCGLQLPVRLIHFKANTPEYVGFILLLHWTLKQTNHIKMRHWRSTRDTWD